MAYTFEGNQNYDYLDYIEEKPIDQEWIKKTVKEIYDNERYPRTINAIARGRISELPDQKFLSPYMYSNSIPCLQQIQEDLAEIKGLDNREELFEAYADFGRDLFNNNVANLDSIRRLLKNRLDELERAYYMQTRPIMKFLTHDEIAEKIYSLDSYNFDRLASMLCYMNVLGFEKLLKEMPDVYQIFTSAKIGLLINQGKVVFNYELSPDRFIPEDSNYLIRRVSKGKDIVLRYEDINYKLLAINRLLEKGLFDYKITKVSKVAPKGIEDEILNRELKKDYINSTNRFKKPPREKLDDWINQIAKSITRSGKSDIENPQTIELYLKFLVEYPMSTVGEIKEKVLENGKLPKCDTETFSDLSFGAVRGWEKKFFKGLRDRFYVEYAQTFKRYRESE